MLEKTRITWICAGILALLTAACSGESARGAHAAEEPVAGYPRTVETFDGATLTLERPALRIVPANASAVDFLCALGACDRIIAVPAPAFGYANADLVRDDWNGKTFDKYLAEPVLRHLPDLVITHEWQNPETTRIVQDAGVPVLTLPEPKEIDDILASLRVVGEVLGNGDEARALTDDLLHRIDSLKSESRKDLRVLSYTNFGTGAWTAAKGTTADLLIGFAGMRNISAELGLEGHADLDLERLLTIDPDVILVGSSAEDPTASPTANYLRSEKALASLSALKAERVVVLPMRLFTTNSHHIVDAAEALAEAVDAVLDR